MAKNEGGQEKTEQPTGRRLSKAREEGQVAKSQEVNSFAMILAGVATLLTFGGYLGDKISEMTVGIFGALGTIDLHVGVLQAYAYEGLAYLATLLFPFFLVFIVVALAVSFWQVGFLFSTKPLKLKLNKLNIIEGIKNKFFSKNMLVDTAKSVAKLVVIAVVSYLILKDAIFESVGLIAFTPEMILSYMVDSAASFTWKVGIALAVIAIIDFKWQKRKHIQDLKMTKQEVKDETKQSEGDPTVKSRIRGKQMAMARQRVNVEVPKADVVVTNPTHFAVALEYKMGSASAPKVLAKGVDRMAQRIKEIAREHDVPIHEDRELARALYKECEVGDEIPESLFKAVAQALAYVFRQREAKRKSIV